jgi:hypothetical protein
MALDNVIETKLQESESFACLHYQIESLLAFTLPASRRFYEQTRDPLDTDTTIGTMIVAAAERLSPRNETVNYSTTKTEEEFHEEPNAQT